MDRDKIKGLYIENTITGVNYEPGTVLTYQAHIPPAAQHAGTDLALYVLLEHQQDLMGEMLSRFMDEELIPPGMILHMMSGNLPATLDGGASRTLRPEEFDQFGADFTNFLIEEVIPHAVKATAVKLSPSPDMHFITGGSSGGMAAWNAVWFRNDYFRRAYLNSPTFSAMRGGEEAMVLARKTESRPIRVYITAGTEEPDYFFGSSLYAAQNAASALETAGYDFRFELFTGEGHCARGEEFCLWRRMMVFLWANWRTQPVTTLGNPIRIHNLLATGSRWERFDDTMPAKPPLRIDQGTYTYDKTAVYCEQNGQKRPVASGFGKITGLAISPDHWRIAIADETRRFVFAMSICPDGTLKDLYKLAPLHLAHDCHCLGASDLAILEDGRVLAATELGVQGIVTVGLTDLILPLPGDLPADAICVQDKWLYVSSGEKIFRRPLKLAALDLDATPKAPSTPDYGDNFWYVRSHLTNP